jgi:CheY-like chemotaxis protein
MSGHILALEKDAEDMVALKMALESPGHHLIAFKAFYEAVDYLENNQIDLIICNIHLRNGSSFEFLHESKSKRPEVPFLFYCIAPSDLTKPFLHTLSQAAQRLGAEDVIFMEEFDPGELCRQIESHLPPNVPRKCA